MSAEHGKQALRPAEGGMTVANITEETARLKDAAEWKSGDRRAVSLVKNDALNVLLMVLKKGAQLHEHRTKGPIVLQLVSGAIRFVAESNERSLSTGEVVALDRGIPHSLKALEESTLLLITAIN
jgi:quercetin dioxygenase-like cupin family protein